MSEFLKTYFGGKQTPLAIMIACALILIAVFVWPTRYRYDHTGGINGAQILVRIDRLTGETQWFNPSGGWITSTPTPMPPPKPFTP